VEAVHEEVNHVHQCLSRHDENENMAETFVHDDISMHSMKISYGKAMHN
jgi:hypothetical protein